MNTNPASDSVNFIGNEVTGSGSFLGNYSLAGTGHFETGNNIKGVINPAGTTQLAEKSLYGSTLPGYWVSSLPWPVLGTPAIYKSGENRAKTQQAASVFTDCERNPANVYTSVDGVETANFNVEVYPNPAHQQVIFNYHASQDNKVIVIKNMIGATVAMLPVAPGKGRVIWNCSSVPAGIYAYTIVNGGTAMYSGKIAVVR